MARPPKKKSTYVPVPPVEYRFKPGQSGNPEGGRKHHPAKRALQKLTVETYSEIIEIVLTGNLAKLKEIAEDPDTPAIQVGIATAFMKALKEGDFGIIERIAERLVGKVPDELKVTSKNYSANLNATVNIDDAKMKAAIAKLEGDV